MARPQGRIEHFQTRFTVASEAAAFGASWHRTLAVSILSVAVLTAFFPVRTHALTLGDLHSFFRPKAEASSSSKSQSVQAMTVLEASMNPNAAKGGAEVIIEDGMAVRAQGGFAGETVIPSKDAISIYVVPQPGQPGGTLSEIATMFDVSVNTIKWANNLKSDTIKPGQVLTILPTSGVRYTVKKGDTIASIAKKYRGDADEIAQFNGISGPLTAGDSIIIPNGQEFIESAPIKKTGGAIATQSSPASAGSYINPLPGGRRTQGIHGTNGVDIAAPVGTPIVAAAAGDVIIALEGGWNGGYGTYVVVRHGDGTQTLYAHMSSTAVGKEQHVNQGQVIGYVGNTGRSSGPHLHFEIRGGPRNPF